MSWRWVPSVVLVACMPVDSEGFDGFATGGGGEASEATAESSSSAAADDPASSDASTSNADGGPCGPDRTCLQPPPDGWKGPLVLAAADPSAPLPSCRDPYPATGPTQLQGWNDPGPAECTCPCALGADDCLIALATYTDGTCGSGHHNLHVMDGGCAPVDFDGTNAIVASVFQQGGTCDETVAVTLPEPVFDAVVRTCTGAPAAACDEDRLCVALPPPEFAPEICITAPGDVPCPDGDYTERTVRWNGTDDTRDCTACACETPTAGSSCVDEIAMHMTEDCSDASAGTIPNLACASNVSALALDLDFVGACAVSKPALPLGDVTPVDPVTYCCAPVP